jgi:hypothetical protein
MLVPRSLTVLALTAALALSVATAGCGKVTARWSDPKPGQAGVAADEPATDQEAPPKRRNSLEMTAETIFFLEGVLPLKANDGTTSALSGSLVLRGQCHDGSLKVMVSSRDGNRETSVRCDGEPHERKLGAVKLGDPIGVRTTGKTGTDFAVELAVR